MTKLSERRGMDWGRTVCALCCPLWRAVDQLPVRAWLDDMALRPDRAAPLPPVDSRTQAQLTELLGADWMDEDLMWLMLALRRHRPHRVVWMVMNMHEASCRELAQAMLLDMEEQELRRDTDSALLRKLIGGVDSLMDQEDPLPPPMRPGRKRAAEIADRMLARLGQEAP